MTPTRQPTRYDEMLKIMAAKAVTLDEPCKSKVLETASCWGTYDKIQILNGVAVADPATPAVQAQGVIDWLCNNGPRPTWLRSITDEELQCGPPTT